MNHLSLESSPQLFWQRCKVSLVTFHGVASTDCIRSMTKGNNLIFLLGHHGERGIPSNPTGGGGRCTAISGREGYPISGQGEYPISKQGGRVPDSAQSGRGLSHLRMGRGTPPSPLKGTSISGRGHSSVPPVELDGVVHNGMDGGTAVSIYLLCSGWYVSRRTFFQ